ncbi:Hypothetical protein HDN1F_14590 [gamma proteobacterium HdN1]|nr:Hypothetical protein HDN1F_14590 [gamma proteobacterium HdN1]
MMGKGSFIWRWCRKSGNISWLYLEVPEVGSASCCNELFVRCVHLTINRNHCGAANMNNVNKNDPKRIVICSDGTWNTPDQKPTNVVKLVRSILPRAYDGRHQVVFYDQGIGTGDLMDRYMGGIFGYGMEQNVLDAYRFLVHNYEEGDDVYFFGFSRGAYTVRAAVGLVHLIGLIKKDRLAELGNIYKYYRTPPEKRELGRYSHIMEHRPAIRMVGVFDTVGALGAPLYLPSAITQHWVKFYDTSLSDIVKNAYQALALDERRAPFVPSLWTGVPVEGQLVEQCWFAGAHSDIGGGYARSGLSDVTLKWMVDNAVRQGLDFDDQYLNAICKPNPSNKPHDSLPAGSRMLGSVAATDRRVFGEPLADPKSRPLNVRVHETVYQQIAHQQYKPINPDFPFELGGVQPAQEQRKGIRYAGNGAPSRIQIGEREADCELLDFSRTGVRVAYRGEPLLDPQRVVAIRSSQTGDVTARCVWREGNQFGLQLVAA